MLFKPVEEGAQMPRSRRAGNRSGNPPRSRAVTLAGWGIAIALIATPFLAILALRLHAW